MKKLHSAEKPPLLADENIAVSLVERLRAAEWDVTYIAELEPGLTDLDVLQLSNQDSRCLLTEDHDFGELIFRQQRIAAGIILLRVPSGKLRDWNRVVNLMNGYQTRLRGSFVVIEPDRIRIRPL